MHSEFILIFVLPLQEVRVVVGFLSYAEYMAFVFLGLDFLSQYSIF